MQPPIKDYREPDLTGKGAPNQEVVHRFFMLAAHHTRFGVIKSASCQAVSSLEAVLKSKLDEDLDFQGRPASPIFHGPRSKAATKEEGVVGRSSRKLPIGFETPAESIGQVREG